MPWPIFGDMKAIKPFYLLTGFLTLYPRRKREKEGSKFLYKFNNHLVMFPYIPFKGTV